MVELQHYDNSLLVKSDLIITDVRWGGGRFGVYYGHENITFEEKGDETFPICELYVDVFDKYTKSLYRIEFEYIQGYRLLDEGGLLSFWTSKDYKKLGSIVKVINSSWKEESIIPFIYTNNTSFLIVTDNECVEVITKIEPKIHFIKKLKSKEGNRLENNQSIE